MMDKSNTFKPLYFQLREQIIQLIEEEQLNINEPIPSEPTLMKEYDLSRTTVRKALDMLVNEGYLYRVQGKGTFVNGRKVEQGLINLSSCTEDIIRMGLTPKYKLLSQEIIPATPQLASNLNVPEDELIFQLERVIYGDLTPVNTTKSYVPYKYVKGIEQYNFEKESLYRILEEKYHIKIQNAVRSIEAVLCDKDNAEKLQVREGSPLIRFEGQVKMELEDGKVIQGEYFKTYYRTDHVKFYINQHR